MFLSTSGHLGLQLGVLEAQLVEDPVWPSGGYQKRWLHGRVATSLQSSPQRTGEQDHTCL